MHLTSGKVVPCSISHSSHDSNWILEFLGGSAATRRLWWRDCKEDGLIAGALAVSADDVDRFRISLVQLLDELAFFVVVPDWWKVGARRKGA